MRPMSARRLYADWYPFRRATQRLPPQAMICETPLSSSPSFSPGHHVRGVTVSRLLQLTLHTTTARTVQGISRCHGSDAAELCQGYAPAVTHRPHRLPHEPVLTEDAGP